MLLSPSEQADMCVAVQKLKELGAISACKRLEGDFTSRIFLAPKSNGGKRFILNLKALNKFIEKTHFKMEDHRTAAKLVPKNGFLATIDLTEAYLLVPVSKAYRKYLRFEFVQLYEFNALPYGLSIAPRVFTKLMKEVITHLRNKGFQSVIYLDDILCIGDSYEECRRNVNETCKLLECLGFVLNKQKSVLHPQQTCRFLGFLYNTVDLTLSLPSDKRSNILRLIHKFMNLPTCSIREFSQLIGVLVAACPSVKYGWLYTKSLERIKFLALQEHGTYEAKIKLPISILPDLRWWEHNVAQSNNTMRPKENFELEIYTDASRTGWGAFCKGRRANGGWTETELLSHINYLELLAVFMGLKCFARNASHCSVLLRVDNTTAISYVNRMGGVQFPHLNKLAREIWQWCEKQNIFLFASYINTHDNVEADEESRRINIDTEWELCDWAFQKIIHRLGVPEIDLFASRTNTKCSQYISWKPDPDALAVDSFTVTWYSKFFYAFPPFSMILKCLRKILDDKAFGILVFPYWPGQPWFPLLKSMLRSEIIIFEPNTNLLRSRFRTQHPLHSSLSLGAATLSGLPS